MAAGKPYESDGERIKAVYAYWQQEQKAAGNPHRQEDFAREIGLSPQRFSILANGHDFMRDDGYASMARVTGMRMEYLKNEDDFMFDADLYAFEQAADAKWFSGHIELLKSICCTVTPMLYLKINGFAALQTYWQDIKPTLTSECSKKQFAPDSISLGEWNGESLEQLGFAHARYSTCELQDAADWNGYNSAKGAFWHDGLRVRSVVNNDQYCQISPNRYARTDMDSNNAWQLYYVLRYRVEYENISPRYEYEEKSTHYYSSNQLISMFEDMDTHILAVMHSNAHSRYIPDYDDEFTDADAGYFDWNSAE